MTKTFNIGEYCKYGTIQVKQENLQTTIKLMDYKTNNVREQEKFHVVDKAKIQWYLEDFTTPYYADKIINWLYN